MGAKVCAATILANEHWERRDLPAAASVPVVYLEGSNDSYPCGINGETSVVTDDKRASQYCPDTNTIIVSSQSLLRRSLPGDTSELGDAEVALVIYHEKGHAAQDAAGQKFAIGISHFLAQKRNELQGDCLAGQTSEDNPDIKRQDTITVIVRSAAKDKTHGGFAERQKAFIHGADGGFCNYATLEAEGIIPPLPEWDSEMMSQESYQLPR